MISVNQCIQLLTVAFALSVVSLFNISTGDSEPSVDLQGERGLLAQSGFTGEPTPSTSLEVITTPQQRSISRLTPGEATRNKLLSLEGSAFNLSVNKSDGVKLKISKRPGVTGQKIYAEGAFTGKRLFGKFSVSGRELRACDRGATCLIFNGLLDLSGQGGWSAGTHATFSISLVISPDDPVVRGVYHIGELPSLGYHQYGQLTLRNAD